MVYAFFGTQPHQKQQDWLPPLRLWPRSAWVEMPHFETNPNPLPCQLKEKTPCDGKIRKGVEFGYSLMSTTASWNEGRFNWKGKKRRRTCKLRGKFGCPALSLNAKDRQSEQNMNRRVNSNHFTLFCLGCRRTGSGSGIQSVSCSSKSRIFMENPVCHRLSPYCSSKSCSGSSRYSWSKIIKACKLCKGHPLKAIPSDKLT